MNIKKPIRKQSNTPVAKLKRKLWNLCRELTRDVYGNICFTCGRSGLEGSNWQTGHFITSSTCSTELRYDIKNLRPQCYHCNINLSGNWQIYEQRLIDTESQEYVNELKSRNQKTKGLKYDSLWFEFKIKEYQDLLK